jgi:hypothetical protein
MAWVLRFSAVGWIVCLGVSVAALGQGSPPEHPTVPPGQTRGEKALKGGPMRYFANRPDQADVVSATFLGGKGHEFLCDGGIQRDGTVVLAGNVVGGEFDLGVRPDVLGTEGAPPPAANVQPRGGRGTDPKTTASWRNPQATGFIVRCRKDLAGILSVTRLPWLSAAITAAKVGPDDAIYIAGRATPDIGRLGARPVELSVSPDAERKGGECDSTFLAKLSADGRRIEWLKTLKGLSDAPRLGQTRDGRISFLAQDVRTFTAAGEQKSLATIPGGVRENSSVSPIDGTIVRGGEHNSGTGREPWRCPTLWTFTPDGKPQYQLYDWGGPYVVLDDCRLVSDTAVRMVSHDREGNILAVLWSDGGNSVASCQPNDIRTHGGGRGVGLTTAGAGATSFAYLARIEPKNFQHIGFTLWCSQYGGKANGASVDALGQVDDGSFAFAGSSAWGLSQTSNKLANGEPAGQYVAVLNKDLNGVRFSSATPGAGVAEVNTAGTAWGIASGTVDGKPKVLFIGSAARDADVYGLVTATGTHKAMQGAFGGGACDGYVIMLDLSRTAPPDANAGRLPIKPARLSAERHAQSKNRKPGKNEVAPQEGEVFHFRPTYPKWTTVDAEFRDPSGNFWPSFCYGNPVAGQIAWQGGNPQGSFEVACTKWCQPGGDQGRRILGPLIPAQKDAWPKVALRVASLGPMQTRPVTVDSGPKAEGRELSFYEADAVLDVAGRTVKVRAQCVVRPGGVVESGIRKTQLYAYFTIKGRDLGLAADRANADIDVRFGMQAHAGDPPAGRRR